MLNDAAYLAALRKGERERADKARAHRSAYAKHPLHRISEHQFGFTMLTRAAQEILDADFVAERDAAWSQRSNPNRLQRCTGHTKGA